MRAIILLSMLLLTACMTSPSGETTSAIRDRPAGGGYGPTVTHYELGTGR